MSQARADNFNTCRIIQLLIAASMLVGSLYGCASGASKPTAESANGVKITYLDKQISGKVRFFGHIDIATNPKGGTPRFTARFGQFEQAVSESTIVDAFAPGTSGRCKVSTRTERNVLPDELAFPDNPYRFVSAGPAVHLNYLERFFTQLNPITELTEHNPRTQLITYKERPDSRNVIHRDPKLLSIMPRGLDMIFVIPGNQFPAIRGMSVNAAPSIRYFNHGHKGPVTANTVFRWQPGLLGSNLIGLSARYKGKAIHCVTRDTGSFSFPEHIQELLGDDTLPKLDTRRGIYRFYRNADSIVVVSQSIDYH